MAGRWPVREKRGSVGWGKTVGGGSGPATRGPGAGATPVGGGSGHITPASVQKEKQSLESRRPGFESQLPTHPSLNFRFPSAKVGRMCSF
jgi:hypothetical protein